MADFKPDNQEKSFSSDLHFGGVSVNIDECRDVLDQDDIDFEHLNSIVRSWHRDAIVEGSLVYIDERAGGWLNNSIEQLHVIEDLGHGSRMRDKFFEARPVFGDYLLVSHGSHDKVYKVPADTELTCIKGDVADEDVHFVGDTVICQEIPDEWLVKRFNLEHEMIAVTV